MLDYTKSKTDLNIQFIILIFFLFFFTSPILQGRVKSAENYCADGTNGNKTVFQ